jgi:hypothetical protein
MSGTVDLIGEYRGAVAAVIPRYRARFAELGLIHSANKIGLCGVAAAAEASGGVYQPEEGAPLAVILPVWDCAISDARVTIEHPELLVDLVAWRPKQPAWLLSRCGVAGMLGAEALAAAVVAREPLRLFRDPGGWARAGGGDAGAVVIDWSVDLGLLGLRALVCDDVEHGAEVKANLKKLRAALVGRVPQIRVPTASVGVSA